MSSVGKYCEARRSELDIAYLSLQYYKPYCY